MASFALLQCFISRVYLWSDSSSVGPALDKHRSIVPMRNIALGSVGIVQQIFLRAISLAIAPSLSISQLRALDPSSATTSYRAIMNRFKNSSLCFLLALALQRFGKHSMSAEQVCNHSYKLYLCKFLAWATPLSIRPRKICALYWREERFRVQASLAT